VPQSPSALPIVAQVILVGLGIPAPEANGVTSIAVIDSINTIARIFRFIFPFSFFISTITIAIYVYLTIMEQGSSVFLTVI
jgi:hypothetical protein